MKVKLIYNSKFANLINVGAITLYPFIFFSMSKEEALERRVLHHEFVHVRQVRTNGWFDFYIKYIWNWVVALFQQKPINYPHTNIPVDTKLERAYYNIKYEQEAYALENMLVLTPDELKEVV